jgi:hypothetical protein
MSFSLQGRSPSLSCLRLLSLSLFCPARSARKFSLFISSLLPLSSPSLCFSLRSRSKEILSLLSYLSVFVRKGIVHGVLSLLLASLSFYRVCHVESPSLYLSWNSCSLQGKFVRGIADYSLSLVCPACSKDILPLFLRCSLFRATQ